MSKANFTGKLSDYVAKRKNKCAACCNPIVKGQPVFRAEVDGWNPNFEGNDTAGCSVIICRKCGDNMRSGKLVVRSR